MTTLGTHNLLDGKAPATPFADVIFFTEAHPINRLPGFGMWKCPSQRDLVISVDDDLGWDDLVPHYKKAHWGVRKVTPNRGTFWLTSVSPT